jgi:glycosyltransferase involved in cell wall biosynthesis
MKKNRPINKNRLTVVQMLPELESGGVERGTLELSRYLTEKGHRSMVISGGGRMVVDLEKSGGEHITWPVGEKSPVGIPYIFFLRALLIREKVDILHLRSRVPAWIGVLALKSLPKNRRPALITTFHGFYSIHRFSAVMTKGDRVIAISKVIQEHLKKEYGVAGHRIRLIHRGFDETIFNPAMVSEKRVEAIKAGWGLGGCKDPVIVLPGRLTLWKGQDIFIKSLGALKQREPELAWQAVCVGDKEENAKYARILEKLIDDHDLSDRVRLGGHCSDMPGALMAADIVVSASSTEPEAFGRIAVEAQAMARPIIASAHGGSLETVKDGETGWLVPPMDIDALAHAVSDALSNPSRREEYGQNGRKWARRYFTTDKMCEATLNVYQEVVSEFSA